MFYAIMAQKKGPKKFMVTYSPAEGELYYERNCKTF